MLHPLEQKMIALRRRGRRLAMVRGLSAVAAILLAVAAAIGSIDWLLRFEDQGVRIIASLTALGVAAWSCRRFLGFAYRAPVREIDLAMRVERSFPNLKDELSSAIEFLSQSEDDPTAGSAALRRAAIAQASAETQDLDFSAVLDRRPARRAAALLAATCFAAGILVLMSPADARIAVARLVNPLGDAAWQRTTHLIVRRPVQRIARGGPFQIEVVDAFGVRLPPEVRIHYRDETLDGGVVEEAEPMRFAAGVMTARRENVQRSFFYRVEGGDDRSMPWLRVEVVEPPAVEWISVQLVPPAYTGWPTSQSERDIHALAGTEVRINGQATKPLASADLCLEDGRKIPAKLGDDGAWFTIGYGGDVLKVEKSGAYWFALTDREDLRGGTDDRWEIRVTADLPPTVRIERPTANLFVTPKAVVPIRVSAKDDLAIRDIALMFRYGKEGKETERSLSLHAGPKQAPRLSAPRPVGDSREVDYSWNLAPLDLQPGTQVTFWATAGDYLPQTGKSDPRRLIVVTPDELQDRIAVRGKLIVAELQRAAAMQRTCRSQVETLVIRLAELRRFEQNDADRLQAAQHGQGEVGRLLTSRSEGVPMHILGLLDDLENNRLDGADTQRQMAALLEELDRLDREHLPPMDHELTAVVKTVQVAREGQGGLTDSTSNVAASLAAVGKHQDAVVAALEQWLARLARWDSYRRFHREIAQLLHDQEDVARSTSEVGRRTLTRDPRDLTPQDAADLKTAAGRQIELAQWLDRVLQEMEQAGVALRRTDPLAAETVADALAEARRLAIADDMRNAGDQIQRNQIGQAAAGQKQIALDLQAVLDILADRRQQEAARLVKKLRELDSDLSALEQRQEGLCKKLASPGESKDEESRRRELERLAAEQRKLRQETQRLGRQLERLQAEKAATAAARAVEQMEQAERGAGQGDGVQAQAQAAEARRSLADARRQLADAVRRTEAELAQEQIAKLEDQVKHLRRRQDGALEEARRLRGIEESLGQLTRSQLSALQDLTRLQHSLEADTTRLGRQLAGAAAFRLALDGAAGDMAQAAKSLDRRETGAAAQDRQRLGDSTARFPRRCPQARAAAAKRRLRRRQ